MIRRISLGSLILTGIIFILLMTNPNDTQALNPSHISCSTCHSLHSSPGQSLTNEAVRETLCLSCHMAGPGIVVSSHTNIDGSAHSSFSITCTDCHNSHNNMQNYKGGTNLKQVGTRTSDSTFARVKLPSSAGGGTADVIFEQRGSDADPPYDSSLRSFADGDEDGDSKFEGVCEVCHTATLHHRNDGTGNIITHDVGKNCIECHAHDEGFEGAGGGCCGCHSSVKGTRRAVVGEFSLASHHASSPAVDADCKVCHHEGMDDGLGGITTSSYHNNGSVDLRGPDNNGVITFTQFSRDTGSDALESWVVDVQDDFCFKCHDIDGALNESNPSQPFSSGNSPVNVFDQFDPGQDNHHAIRGSVSNPYCTSITLEAPWNSGEVISCFDCHGISGHGSSNQRMLRVSIDFDAMEAAATKTDLPSGMGATVEAFCTLCHKSSIYVDGNLGSVFEYHGSDMSQHSASGNNQLGCMGCHAGINNFWLDNKGNLIGDNGSARGNIHGRNFSWPAQSFASGSASERFQVGGWLSGWGLSGSTGYCRAGTCAHANQSKTYTAATAD